MSVLYFLLVLHTAFSFRCDRKPYGSNTQSSPSDGRFKLEVLGNDNNAYIPEQLYTVQIKETDDQSRFTMFMISAEGDVKPDPRNPRRIISLYPGELRPQTTATAKFSDRCLYSVEQAMNSFKSSVEVYWQAPSSGNGCVTLRAMVAINNEVWYEDGSPLTQKVCEDMRQPDDVAPQLNYECGICDEAKYELSFTGVWSRNTHPYLYPENDWLPKYSDLVGASHNAEYILWMPGTLATEGLRDLAEHTNSSNLEAEIRGKIGDGVRTLIKGKGHGYRKMSLPTYSFFRVNKENHLFSAVVALYPSPDWFLGVTRFELCQEDNTWLPERELNLYPWDAGTDSGVSYEAANIVTFPQDAVARVEMSSYDRNSPFYEMDIKDMHPFGKFHIKLIRTYHRECEEETTDVILEEPPPTEEPKSSEEASETSEEAKPEPPEPSRYQTQLDSAEDGRCDRSLSSMIPCPHSEAPLVTDPESSEDCPMSPWQEWSTCDGECEDGRVTGYRWRERYHLVDGFPIEKYDPHAKHHHKKEVTKFCKTHFNTFEREACEEDCINSEDDDEDITVERRIMAPILPGGKWKSKRRDLKTRN